MEQDPWNLDSAPQKPATAECLRQYSQSRWNAEGQIRAGSHCRAWAPDSDCAGRGGDLVLTLLCGCSYAQSSAGLSFLEANASSA